MANGTKFGFASLPSDEIEEVLDWDSVESAFNGTLVLRRLSTEGGLRFTVLPNTVGVFTLALGVFESGVVTSLDPMQRYYTSLFKDLEEVLEFTLEHAEEKISDSRRMDDLILGIPISEEQKLLICNATHSYLANTELLLDNSGRPVFIVNEGEYRMMNTLDLTVDQAFWELIFSPWTVKKELEFLQERSLYTDALGIAFSHDQGVGDAFTAVGNSVYELPNLLDCFSYMSYEETLNWLLTACLYCQNTHDTLWAEEHHKIMSLGLESLISRDQNGDGIMDADSDRCEDGSEITTYDSLDISLGQARNNLYLAVKAWGAFVSLSAFFRTAVHDTASAEKALDMAFRISKTVCSYYLEDEKYIPAVFEGGNQSRIIPAIEGLIYPFLCGAPEAVAEDGTNGAFIRILKNHLKTVLVPGQCLDAISGGWKLSSTSHNTWLSKIFLNQFVAKEILHIDDALIRRDVEHATWLFGSGSLFSMTDQVDSTNGKALGSRLYPRLVTSILWLLPFHGFGTLSLPVSLEMKGKEKK